MSAAQELQEIRRTLLRTPLLLAGSEPEQMRLMIRHRHALTGWFSEQLGWRLIVDPQGTHARLFKVARHPDAHRAACLGSKVFTRRHYTLLCLTLTCLDDGSAQTTLARLVDALAVATPAPLEPFDSSRLAERRALTDVLRFLSELGVVRPRDGDLERYSSSSDADVLLDVDDRLLGHLISAPLPPSSADTIEAMLQEDFYADTDDGRRQQARHAVMRRLVDDPVLYLADLTDGERSWLEHSWAFVATRLREDLGLILERRQEGAAAIDPSAGLTDIRFPDAGSTVKHAALLLCERWPDARCDAPAVPLAALEGVITTAALTFAPRWSKVFAGVEGLSRLTHEALQLLEGMHITRRATETTWNPTPVMARFAVASGAPT